MSIASPLFQPFTLKTLNLANRIVMAPMTRSFSPVACRRPRLQSTTASGPPLRWA
jgi:2,4-dienoyl-CoA reductase-like NADH-dependent reductase (Old Yellow Enzyme family)